MYYVIGRLKEATTRVAKMPIIQGCHPRRVFWFYIYNVRCQRYLHAKFQQDLPKKKLKIFYLKICCILFRSHCTHVSGDEISSAERDKRGDSISSREGRWSQSSAPLSLSFGDIGIRLLSLSFSLRSEIFLQHLSPSSPVKKKTIEMWWPLI